MRELVGSLSRLELLVERLDDHVMRNWNDGAGQAFRRSEIAKIRELIEDYRLHASAFETSMSELAQARP